MARDSLAFTITVAQQIFTGADYDAASIPQTLTFAPGTTEQCFDVEVINDTINELTETFTVSGRPEGSSGPPASTIITIEDDDGEGLFLHSSCLLL